MKGKSGAIFAAGLAVLILGGGCRMGFPLEYMWEDLRVAGLRRTEDIETLIVTLGTKDEHVRHETAKALGEIGPKAVAPILEAFPDLSAEGREGAATALGAIKDPRAAPTLIAALQDRAARVRKAAAHALGQIGDLRAVEPLIGALRDASVEVRQQAAMSLSRLGDPRAIAPLAAEMQTLEGGGWHTSALALWELRGRGGIEALVELLKHGTAFQRKEAAWVFGQKKAEATVPLLIAAAKDPASPVRVTAVHALWLMKEVSGPLVFREALEDREPRVRSQAAIALGALKDPAAVEPLILALKDPDPTVRAFVAAALGEIGENRAAQALIAALSDGDPQVRAAAMRSLGALRNPDAVEPLIAALRSETGFRKGIAAEALGRIGDARAGEPLIQIFETGSAGPANCEPVAKALVMIGDTRGFAALGEVLSRSATDEPAQRAAVAALAATDDPHAVESLVEGLKVGDSRLQMEVARILGRKRDSRAVEPLVALLQAPGASWFSRAQAATALGEIGDRRAVGALGEALRDKEPYVRRDAARALGNFQERLAVESLIAAWAGQPPLVSREIAGSLERITRQRFGEDRVLWSSWWEKNRVVWPGHGLWEGPPRHETDHGTREP